MKHKKELLTFKDFFLEERAPNVDLDTRANQYIDAFGKGIIKNDMTLQAIGAKLFELHPDDPGFKWTNTITRIQKVVGDEPRRDYYPRKSSYPEGTIEQKFRWVGTRDQKVRIEKLASYGNNGKPIKCDICFFDPLNTRWQSIYPGITQENSKLMFEVHHNKMKISAGERITNPIEDTLVLCGNCHAIQDALQ